VVLKFMKNKKQFRRTVDSRKSHKLDPNHVVDIAESYREDADPFFGAALKSNRHPHFEDLSEYKHSIAMPCADRNLDTIFRSERPSGIKIRDVAKDVADAVAHIHTNGMIHGDVKLHAVRVGTHRRLIDFDASVRIGEGYFAGAKFSSGMLPPEMIAELTLVGFKSILSCFELLIAWTFYKSCSRFKGFY
jgi:serine/threonine protein kinase